MHRVLVVLLTLLALTVGASNAAVGSPAASSPASTTPSAGHRSTLDRLDGRPTVDRLAGPNRYGTAARVAQEWPSGQAVVFVVNGEAYPDAISAASRAGMVNAPVLLTETHRIPVETQRALRHVRAERIVVVGGTSAVSADVVNSLKAHASRRVERVNGSDRYATASAMAAKYDRGVSQVFLASGQNFPDALAAAALAGHRGAPLLLTRTTSLDAVTTARLRELAAGEVVVLGGQQAVSTAVARKAASLTTSRDYERLSGKNRYDTAAKIAEQFPVGASPAYVASGEVFPDALVGAALAARRGVPVILTPADHVAVEAARSLARLQPDAIDVLGGERVIHRSTAAALGEPADDVPTTGALLGGYLGPAMESPDQRFAAAFGDYPDLASTYYQAWGRGGGLMNFDYERSRIARGTIPVLTVTSVKGPYTMAEIGSGAADAWISYWAEQLAALDSEVWFTFDHEFEVKLNQGKWVDPPTIQEYARAFNRFQSRVKAEAPKVKFLYWYGYSDTDKIGQVGSLLDPPDLIALDPYVFDHHRPDTSFEAMVTPKLEWLRSRSWYEGQPIVLGEFAKDTGFGDQSVAAFLEDLRPRMDSLGIHGALYFSRDKRGNIQADITRGWPQAREAFGDSVEP